MEIYEEALKKCFCSFFRLYTLSHTVLIDQNFNQLATLGKKEQEELATFIAVLCFFTTINESFCVKDTFITLENLQFRKAFFYNNYPGYYNLELLAEPIKIAFDKLAKLQQ